MRKKIIYDKKYLAEVLNYSQVPVRQILSLNIKPMEQLLLIQLFSHADNWGVSFNQISNSFNKKKNRNDIKQCFESLISKGYLIEKNDVYYIILTKIQSDYESFLTRRDSSASIDRNATNDKNTTIDNSATSLIDSYTNRGVIVPLTWDDSSTTSQIDSYATTNNIKKNIKEKELLITSIQTEVEDLDFLKQDKIKNHTSSSVVNNQNSIVKNGSNINFKNPEENSISKYGDDLKPKDELKRENSKSEVFNNGNPNEVEITQEVETNSNYSLSHIPSFHYSPIEIQHQIEVYLKSDSIYFKDRNQNLVSNSFTEYYNQYPNTKMSISKFEQVLFVQLQQLTMSLDANELNSYLNTHPIQVNPTDTHNVVKMINDNLSVQETFIKIIEDANTISNDNN